MATAERCDARIARGGMELVELRRPGELPGERMLASARPDQEHLHTRTLASAVDGFESATDREGKRQMLEPGLDKHLWESWWEQFDEDVQTSPGEALSELDGLIAQMLEARGYAIDDPVMREGDDRDVVADFLAAREITRAVEQDKVDPEDIDTAIGNYRELYEFLIEDRAAP
jgi:hypothetical protein